MPRRRYTAGHYALELDGQKVGTLNSAAGGDATAAVIEENDNRGTFVKKHLGAVKYDDLRLTYGSEAAGPLVGWLAEMLEGTFARRSGAVLTLDFDSTTVGRREFSRALLAEVAFPALDAGSKDPAQLTIRLAPEYTRRVAGGGKSVSPGRVKQKQWSAGIFQIAIDGLDCKRVMKVEPLVVRAKMAADDVGERRDFDRAPTQIDVSDLVITLPESDARSLYAWHEDFVIGGNCFDANEKCGTLELLAPNTKETLLAMTLRGSRHLRAYARACDDRRGHRTGHRVDVLRGARRRTEVTGELRSRSA
jgi:T4-like virus tail tube protein gp19